MKQEDKDNLHHSAMYAMPAVNVSLAEIAAMYVNQETSQIHGVTTGRLSASSPNYSASPKPWKKSPEATAIGNAFKQALNSPDDDKPVIQVNIKDPFAAIFNF